MATLEFTCRGPLPCFNYSVTAWDSFSSMLTNYIQWINMQKQIKRSKHMNIMWIFCQESILFGGVSLSGVIVDICTRCSIYVCKITVNVSQTNIQDSFLLKFSEQVLLCLIDHSWLNIRSSRSPNFLECLQHHRSTFSCCRGPPCLKQPSPTLAGV